LEQLVIQETHLGSSLLVAQQRDSIYGATSMGCILILARYPLEIAAFRAVDVSSGIIIKKHTFAQKISFRFMLNFPASFEQEYLGVCIVYI
jgi:hypothetical protein